MKQKKDVGHRGSGFLSARLCHQKLWWILRLLHLLVLAATTHSHPSQQLVPDLNDAHNCVGKLVFTRISFPSGISGLQHVAGVAQRPDIESEDTSGAQQTRRA